MKGFMPNGVNLNEIVELRLCSNCVLQRCSEYCNDAINLKKRIISHLISLLHDTVMQDVMNEWNYIKQYGGKSELS